MNFIEFWVYAFKTMPFLPAALLALIVGLIYEHYYLKYLEVNTDDQEHRKHDKNSTTW